MMDGWKKVLFLKQLIEKAAEAIKTCISTLQTELTKISNNNKTDIVSNLSEMKSQNTTNNTQVVNAISDVETLLSEESTGIKENIINSTSAIQNSVVTNSNSIAQKLASDKTEMKAFHEEKTTETASNITKAKTEIINAVAAVQNLFKSSGEATLENENALAGKTYWSGTVLNTGTMPDKTVTKEYTVTPTVDSTNKIVKMQLPERGLYNTANYLKCTFATLASKIGLTAAKLGKGNTVLGIDGTYEGTRIYYLGTGTSFNVKSLFPNEWNQLTKDNFIVAPQGFSATGSGSSDDAGNGYSTPISASTSTSSTLSKTYSDGVLSIGNISGSNSNTATGSNKRCTAGVSASVNNIKVYLVIGEIKSL